MNTAVIVLRHAIGLLTRQPLKTLGVVAPALVLMAGVTGVAAIALPELLTINPSDPDWAGLGSGRLASVLIATFIVGYALMAILWHRHTLGSARAPLPLNPALVWSYLWRILTLGAIQLILSVAFSIPLLISGQNADLGADGPSVVSILLTALLSQFVVMWLLLRLSLILPAAAVGRPIKMALSWRYTRPLSRPMWGIAGFLAVIGTAITFFFAMVGNVNPNYMLALALPLHIIEGLLIFSVLTTLYARQIQKVDLSPL